MGRPELTGWEEIGNRGKMDRKELFSPERIGALKVSQCRNPQGRPRMYGAAVLEKALYYILG